MTSWRERIEAARAAGTFSPEDRVMIGDYVTCMVGEAARVLGPDIHWVLSRYPDLEVMGIGHGWPDGRGPTHVVNGNEFDTASDMLDAIEDRVLQIKRGDA